MELLERLGVYAMYERVSEQPSTVRLVALVLALVIHNRLTAWVSFDPSGGITGVVMVFLRYIASLALLVVAFMILVSLLVPFLRDRSLLERLAVAAASIGMLAVLVNNPFGVEPYLSPLGYVALAAIGVTIYVVIGAFRADSPTSA